MNVLYINTLYHPFGFGGAERFQRQLAESMARGGHDVTVVSVAEERAKGTLDGVRVHYIPVPNLYAPAQAKTQPSWKKPVWHLLDTFNPLLGSVLQAIIAEENPDIVHTNNLSGISVRAWKIVKALGLPLVHTLHDYYLMCPRSVMFKGQSPCQRQCPVCRMYSFPRKHLSLLPDAVVGVSRYVLEKHRSHGYFPSAQQTLVIPNPIAVGPSKKLFSPEKLRLGYVGTLARHKGIEFLLERIGPFLSETTELHLFGKGITEQYERHLRSRYEHPAILFHGFRSPEKVFAAIDVLLVPSLCEETFGRVVAEAFVHHIPVLASNRGALPELVSEGKNGYVFNPDKANDFEAQCDRIIGEHDKLDVFDVAAFYPGKVRDSYVALYEQLIDKQDALRR